MLDTLVAFALSWFRPEPPPPLDPVRSLAWDSMVFFTLPPAPDPELGATVDRYLSELAASGASRDEQGLWIASAWSQYTQHQGTIPLSAASLTKIATTLASLQTWGANHRFETRIGTTGSLEDGVLSGDLIVVGGGDPLFVWEDAIAIGNRLAELGIDRVRGNLIVVGEFHVNFNADATTSGGLLRQGINAATWSSAARGQHARMPEGTPRPRVAVTGGVRVADAVPEEVRWRLRHESLPLSQILQQMNAYSNNQMSEILAQAIGGGPAVADIAIAATEVPANEIQLINGSGLGFENRISPRATCEMLAAIARLLEVYPLTLADVLPVAGGDLLGTLNGRDLPQGTAAKTGTLWRVSSLAGAIPTGDRGVVYFAIINQGTPLQTFRDTQDGLLNQLTESWPLVPLETRAYSSKFGDPARIKSEES